MDNFLIVVGSYECSLKIEIQSKMLTMEDYTMTMQKKGGLNGEGVWTTMGEGAAKKEAQGMRKLLLKWQ